MLKNSHKSRSLLPELYPNKDFFISDIFDNLPFKDDIATMEHPIFTLSKNRDFRQINYINGNISISIAPSIYGLPTIFDKDILLYCGSLLMEQINKGIIPPKTLRISTHDLMVATNRSIGGEGYMLVKKAFDRLKGVSIKTNIKTNKREITSAFGLIDSYEIIESSRVKDRMIRLEITLSDWFYNSIIGKEVLTINRDYFRLGKPLERRLYEIARKHCGNQKEWSILLENLYQKTGSQSPLSKFRFFIKEIAQVNHLPDYDMNYSVNKDCVTFGFRDNVISKFSSDTYPILNEKTYAAARKAAPNYDIHNLEYEWRIWWLESGKPKLHNPDKAFIGFCSARYLNNPQP